MLTNFGSLAAIARRPGVAILQKPFSEAALLAQLTQLLGETAGASAC